MQHWAPSEEESAGLTALPRTLDEAIALFEVSAIARDFFGDAFVDHYVAG